MPFLDQVSAVSFEPSAFSSRQQADDWSLAAVS
jgi:hypothetical protein